MMKVGNLARFSDGFILENNFGSYRPKGIMLSFDEDDDPIVLWFEPSLFVQPEASSHKHIVVLSEC